MDLRDNCLDTLDLSSVCNLETLHCQRNQLGTLTLSGFTLRLLQASSNRLTTVNVYPVPNQLTHMDVSQNLLEYLPDWVCDCRKIELLDVTHNLLSELPPRLLNSLSLRKLLAGNNCLQSVPDLLDHVPLEVLDLQHNKLVELPECLFYKALNLKYLNVSANALESVPLSSQSEESLSTLQELYLTGNNLNEDCGALLVGHQNLRILHIAYNQLLSFPASKLSKHKPSFRHPLTYRFHSTIAEVPRLTQLTTFLMKKKLGMAGQKLGASALLCYIHRETSDPAGHFSLTVANVGTCQAVLCRDGRPVQLSRVYSLENCNEEMERVKLSKAIITEDNKVSGVTCCSRLLGCSYLSPWVLPEPWVHTEPLCSQDEFLILGNRALFERVTYQEAVYTVQAVRDPRAAAKKLCSLAQSYGCKDNIGAVVVSLDICEDSCTCEPSVSITEPRVTPPTPVPVSVTPCSSDPANLSSSSGIVTEFSSETSASEMGSEVGSTASDEHPSSGPASRPERRCSLHPATALCGIMVPGSAGAGTHPGVFQRQPSCATFSSNQSDNGLDSDDEAPLEGVISNGSKLEVEVDIHCCAFQLRSGPPESPKELNDENQGSDYCNGKVCRQNSVVVSATNGCLLAVCGREIGDLKKSPSTSSLFGKKLSNGSVVAPEDSHNIIEVALEAPKKKSGYFTAPAQPDPEDQLIVPPSLEQEVREQLKGQSTLVAGLSAPPTPTSLKDPVWNPPQPPAFVSNLVPGPATILQQEVYDTAL
uniref:PH domain and leucine rich repeat protein phosphatase 2 n=1 Tax=Nothobranchius korthausae TaxID=1143690 RepID=A0A1A8H729_9TELE